MVRTDRRKGVRTLLPRMLAKFAITLLIVWGVGSYYTYRQLENHMHLMQQNAIQAITDGTVAGLSDMIITKNYTHLQETLRQSMDNRNIESIVVTDLTGRVLSEMVRKNGRAVPEFNDEKIAVPVVNHKEVITDKNKDTVVWHKIDSNYQLGWVRIIVNSSEYDHILDNLLYTLCITLIVMIGVIACIIGYQFKRGYNEINRYESHLLDAMHTDPLTKLPNRLCLDGMIKDSMHKAITSKTACAIAFIDLDGFKQINDNMGHDRGDQLLIEVAHRLKNILREDDHVVRLGGDEFVLVLNNIPQQNISALLDRILTRLILPYILNGTEVYIGASMGVTEFPSEQSDPATLIAQADKAMYHSKSLGTNQITHYKDITFNDYQI